MNTLFESSFKAFEKCKESNLEVGDLILCVTSGYHDWTIGYLVEKGEGFCDKPWVIKELVGERLCNISNDSFYKIPIEIPQSIALCGKQRVIYEKCLKAMNHYYMTKFKDLEFDGNICTLNTRKSFSNDLYYSVSFPYNSKTTIKSIVALIETKEQEFRNNIHS